MGKTVRRHDVLVSGTHDELPEAVARVLSASTLDDAPSGEAATVDAAGMRWMVRSWGDPNDPPLLVLHGIMSSAAVYWRLGPALATTGRYVRAIDLPGHGNTGPWNGRYAFLETSEDVVTLIRALEIDADELVVLGHSWGAMVTAGLPAAGLQPATLVLLDPPCLSLDEIVEMTRDPIEHAHESVEEAKISLRVANPDWADGDVEAKAEALTRVDPSTAMAVLSLNGDWDAGQSMLSRPDAARVPVWYVRGQPAFGGLIPDTVVPDLARRVGPDHLLTIAGGSHSPMRTRRPYSLAYAVLEALDGTPPQRQ